VISQNVLNELRFGFTNISFTPSFPVEGADAITQLGLLNVNVSQHPTDGGFPTVNFSDGTGFTPIGRVRVDPTLSSTKQLADNITYTRRKHTFRAGADLRWVRLHFAEIETPSDDYGLPLAVFSISIHTDTLSTARSPTSLTGSLNRMPQ
jgi:hypothetical protein